jgi:glutathione S-transferase
MGDVWKFYAAEISYFSAKVRPALRFKRIPYEELAPTPAAYREVILPRTGLAFIPILITPEDETLQDTSEILDEIERRVPEPAIYPRTPVQRVTAYVLELYADEFMVLPAMHYRWSFPESEAKARADFARATGNAENAGRFADRMKGSRGPLGISEETGPAIEAHLADLLAILERHFERQPFLLGTRMSLADCALLGPLYPHLYLDAVPGRILRERAPRTCAWIARMNEPPRDPGAFLPDDALAPTLRPLFELVGRDAVPLLLDAARAVEAWADARDPALEGPPRIVGQHQTRLRGVAMSRATSAYALWMVERPLDAFAALDDAGRAAVRRAFAGSGLEALLDYRPRHRLGKRRFQLVFEGARG